MSSRKLSSEEVDALMDGLKGSAHDVNADVSGSSDVRAFQFGQDDLSLMGDDYALRLINERFARIARGVFLPMLRVQPRISPFPPEVKTFHEYCDSIDSFGIGKLYQKGTNNYQLAAINKGCKLRIYLPARLG